MAHVTVGKSETLSTLGRLEILARVNIERVQTIPPQNMLLWHNNYLELVIFKKQAQEKL